MSDDIVWGVADFLCILCGSTLLLVSPHLDSAETNLTGQSATICTACGRRTPARDLPQACQSQIAGRLRLLLDDDDLLHVSKALNKFIAGSSIAGRITAGLPDDATDAPSRAAGLDSPSPALQSTVSQKSPGEALRHAGVAAGVDTSRYQLVAKLGASEARLLAAVLDMNVGELVTDKKRNPQFAATRLRRPIVEPAFFTSIEAELVRYKSSGRRTNIGFSLKEVEVLRRGMTTEKEVLPILDSKQNAVGALRFHRMKGVQFGAVEFYRLRQRPGKRRLK